MKNNIRSYRKSRQWTQKELGALIGVTSSTISQMESGLIDPPLGQIKKLVKLFTCTVEELYPDLGAHPLDTEMIQIISLCRGLTASQLQAIIAFLKGFRIDACIILSVSLGSHALLFPAGG